MYKTVRKGENSLQYTILPQTEEVLCNSGVKGKGRDYSPAIYVHRSGRHDRTRTTLILICMSLVVVTILLGVMAITDFYVQKYVITHSTNRQRVNAIVTSVGVSPRDDGVKSRKKELRVSDAPTVVNTDTVSSELPAAIATPMEGSTERVKTGWAISGVRLIWRMTVPPPAPMIEDQEELNIPNGPFSKLRNRNKEQATDAMIHPTVTLEPSTSTVAPTSSPTQRIDNVVSIIPEHKTTIGQDVLISTKYDAAETRPVPTPNIRIATTYQNYPLGKDLKGLKDSILDSDDDDEFKDLEVETMPPMDKIPSKEMLTKVSEYYHREMSESVRKEEIPRMWPFGSSMTMFQWPDYTLEDSMIIPLLVGTATMLIIALVLTAIVARRRRKDLTKAISQIDMNEDAQTDDNTNLLTVEQE